MTEYASVNTNGKIMDVSASTNGSTVSLEALPTSGNPVIKFVRIDVDA
jgi:hypothetical protein